ncbi:MAG: hypothetical protein J0M10_08875 [Chitinophagales bacterium]|nr:hypothetical protein [Chitinophagales bacterium]
MTLLSVFLSAEDVYLFPLCFIVLFLILRSRARKQKEERVRKLYYRAFGFKVICVLAFVLITNFYFKGGDTGLYYQASKDLRAAISAESSNFWLVVKTSKLTFDSPLFPFFYYDNYTGDVTYGYMGAANNFFSPKLALIPSYLFGGSYLCICMSFGFFALLGALRLFKTFYYFFPHLFRELALACIFLPGMAFWSSGLLKDPISFGCIGILLYAFVNIVYMKKNYVSSAIWMAIAIYIMINLKIYILLVLMMSVLIWQFTDFNRLIKDRTLRTVFTILMMITGGVVVFFILRYVTSLEAAQEFKLDNLMESVERERKVYENINRTLINDSHFKINSSNPVLLFFSSITATFFRPFLWEINTPIALLSAMESLVFTLVTLNFFFKKGVKLFFTLPFSDGRILMVFVFAIVFAFAVGSSTGNFGALSRYKIPCTPFYLILVTLLYDKAKLVFPGWFTRIVYFAVPKK